MLRQRKRILRNHDLSVGKPVVLGFTKKEIVWILIFTVIGSFISFIPLIPDDNPMRVLYTMLVFFIIITSTISIKRFVAEKYAIDIEHIDWKLIHWWWFKRAYFKKPLPLGLIVPFFLAIFTIGYLKPFAFLQFNYNSDDTKRSLRRYGSRHKMRKELINEEELGYIAGSGMFMLLLLALIGFALKPYFPAFGTDLTKYSIYYGIWNLLPIGQLDGTKLFFGTTVLWSFLVILFFISFLFVFV